MLQCKLDGGCWLCRCYSVNLQDVDIIAADGVTLACHKCVLDARLQYFHGLFSSTWIEVLTFVYKARY